MIHRAMWWKTMLPTTVINSFIEEIKESGLETEMKDGQLIDGEVISSTRNSKIGWVSNLHWIGGFCYHYILQANESNFGYDINSFEDKHLQYTSYSVGEHYKWHIDTKDSMTESVRKLSFSLQLSDPEEYSGGELQFIDSDDNLFFAPKDKGTIVVFDSRLKHRVRKVRSGCRRSLVGWVEGPRWK